METTDLGGKGWALEGDQCELIIIIFPSFFSFLFFFFPPLWHMEVLQLKVELELWLQPMPQFTDP